MGNKELTEGVVQLSSKDGVSFIEQSSPLTRLHYFDGKFLRADAFALEQDYHRARTRLSNIAGGWGVVNGLSIALAGNQLTVGAGLAITAAGNFVLATGDFGADLAELIEVATPAPVSGNSEFDDCLEAKPGFTESSGLNLYEITVGPVEGLCGNEAVYGKLCESACVSSSQHPYWREGVVLRLRPISLKLPVSSAIPFSSTHLRNRVASAYFAAEPWLTPPALSAAGLASDLWCNPASLYGRDEVVIGLLARDGGVNRVIDAWSGRRERMDTQARSYWQGRMAMRPWNVFVAQILQFQCQLAGLFDGTGGVINPPDDCEALRQLLDKTRKEIEALHKKYSTGTQKILKQFGEKALKKDAQSVADQVKASYAELYEISETLNKAELGQGALPKNRLLLNAGFVELPPAGYLPVVPGKQSLQEQLSRMFGEGVRLHYHAVRRDEIAHLVEEAQHMERISLTRGLDDASRIEDVEIFVPDGEAYGVQQAAPGEWWQVEMAFAAIGAFDLGLSLAKEGSLDQSAPAAREQILEQASKTELAKSEAAAQATAADGMADSSTRKLKINTNAGAAETAARAAATLDAETLAKLRAQLVKLMMSMSQRSVLGLARTEGRADGSYGFTLVGHLDIDDIVAQMRALIEKYPELDPNGAFKKQLQSFSEVSLYVAGDIASDPLDLPLNASVALNGELAMGKAIYQINGQLTALFDRPLSSGRSERVAQLALVMVDAEGKATASRGRISLIRQGTAADGEFILDDANHDPDTSPNFFDWQSAPRIATMSVLDDDATEAVVMKMMRSGSSGGMEKLNTAASYTAGASVTHDTGTRKQLLKMSGLAAMPALDSAIGGAAMNSLISIAEAADDPAFLARARRRLFPTLDTPVTERVRAVLDWVMFRRARTHLCCPQIPVPPIKALEAFQAWHIQVADAAALKALQDALDRNDTKQLAGYKFQRVGVLRYRDESTVAEESEAQIEAMWQQAQPGPQVVLGRYWEEAPTTGQGWQNHFRLRSMLDQISEITTPPVRGDGALARLQAVSPPLSDGALDGGFLVVTQGRAAVTRKALLIYTNWDRAGTGGPGNHFLNAQNPHTDMLFINDAPQGDTLADFIAAIASTAPLNGVTVATPKAAPDAGAPARLKAVVDALVTAGRPAPGPTRQVTEALSTHDREQLLRALQIDANEYDDIVFLEINGGV